MIKQMLKSEYKSQLKKYTMGQTTINRNLSKTHSDETQLVET